MKPVRYLPGFEEDFRAAVDFYRLERAKLARGFLEAVDEAIDSIQGFPEAGSPVVGSRVGLNLRRVSVRRFPYHVLYSVQSEELLLVACAHTSRRPGYWRDRIR